MVRSAARCYLRRTPAGRAGPRRRPYVRRPGPLSAEMPPKPDPNLRKDLSNRPRGRTIETSKTLSSAKRWPGTCAVVKNGVWGQRKRAATSSRTARVRGFRVCRRLRGGLRRQNRAGR